MNQEWENPFSIGTNENNETVIRLGGQLASKRTSTKTVQEQKSRANNPQNKKMTVQTLKSN